MSKKMGSTAKCLSQEVQSEELPNFNKADLVRNNTKVAQFLCKHKPVKEASTRHSGVHVVEHCSPLSIVEHVQSSFVLRPNFYDSRMWFGNCDVHKDRLNHAIYFGKKSSLACSESDLLLYDIR